MRRILFLALLLAATEARAETLRFGVQAFPPFNIDDHGRAAGPFPDIVRAACERIKADCVLTILPWRRLLALVDSGELHGVPVLLHTEERERQFYFGPAIAATNYSLYTTVRAPLQYHEPRDLAGYTVAAYGPSGTFTSASELLQDVPGLKLVTEMSSGVALRKLANGRYGPKGAVFVNQDVAEYLIRQDHLQGLRHAGTAKRIEYFICMVRKSVSPQRAEEFNAALRALLDEGRVRDILAPYGLKPPH
jgi:polar amino acid transport system substrate-binding protein